MPWFFFAATATTLSFWFVWFEEWYRDIKLPAWAPTATVLRIILAVGLTLPAVVFAVLSRDDNRLTSLALGLLWVQLALTASWAYTLFRRRKARTGFYVICSLWTAVALAAGAALSLDVAAGSVMLPWLGALTYVGAFNFFVWQLEMRE